MTAKTAQMTAAEVARMSVVHPRIVREQRDKRIREMRRDGKALQAIGRCFGLTRARVSQICETAKVTIAQGHSND